MNRRSLYFIAIGLISIIVVSSLVIYELTLTRSSILWQRPVENFAVSLAADDGKVFVLDVTAGVVNCFDSQSGRSVWNSSLPGGGFYVSGLVVSGGKVYAGAWDNHVVCLDEATGQFQWSFQGLHSNPPNHPYAPGNIIVKDDRVFCINDAISVHNSTTGELLWQASLAVNGIGTGIGTIMQPNNTWTGGWVTGYPLSGDPFDGNSVYALGGDFPSAHFFKLNTDNGAVLWSSSSVTWNGSIARGAGYWNWLPSVLAITQGQVIIENPLTDSGAPGGNLLFSLNSTTGEELWSINVGATIYNPTVYNNLFIFGAADGNFYALNLANGNTAWKTKVDTQNLFSFVNFTNYAPTSPIQIDSQNQRLFWSFAVKQPATGNYTGTLCSLDLANGNMTWTKQIDDMGNFAWQLGSAYNDSRVFLTYNSALWIFNASTGSLVQSQQFDHYVLPPIVLGNETFVAADLWLFAYV
jgi:outer membrane protein assembly factor BamB